MEWHALDMDLIECLERMLGLQGARTGHHSRPPRYPSRFGRGQRLGLRSRVVTMAISAAGVPRMPRGDVLVWPYWNMHAVLIAARERRAFVPVIDPAHIPPFAARDLLRLARRGGWIGHAGNAARSRSRAAIRRCLAQASDATAEAKGDALDQLLTRRALAMLNEMASDTLADLETARFALRRSSLKTVLVPYDAPPAARILLHAARENGVSSLMLQHGFTSEPQYLQEGTVADVVAVWSSQEALNLRGRARGRIEVTGNPGVESRSLEPGVRPGREDKRTLSSSRIHLGLSVRIDARNKGHHLRAALTALAAARPGTEVIVRPHPADNEPEVAAKIAAQHPTLRTVIDRTSEMVDLIAAADLVIGATSTATLEAAAAGLPIVYLDVARAGLTPPFDGSETLPAASDPSELETLIPEVLSGRRTADVNTARELLGVRRCASERVVTLIRELTQSADPRA